MLQIFPHVKENPSKASDLLQVLSVDARALKADSQCIRHTDIVQTVLKRGIDYGRYLRIL